MAIKVTISLTQTAADLITGYGAGAKLYLERDTTSAFAAPTVAASPALVSGTEQYEIWDADGTNSSWYRSRVGNSGGTAYSDYSGAFQATALQAYATIDDLLETMPGVTATDTRAHNLLSDLLIDASEWITERCGRSFFRSPQVSGTEQRLYHVVRAGERSLARAIGYGIDIVAGSITALELADSTGDSYSTISAGSTGYWTEPQNPATGWPIEDILLSTEGTEFLGFSVGERTARITAAFGWASVPGPVRRATIDLAREWYRQGPGGGGPIGISQLGAPVFSRGVPPSVQQLLRSDYRRRDYLHV